MVKYFSTLALLISSLFSIHLSAQTYTITGKIIDIDSQSPLAFVPLAIQDHKRGTITDIDGKFSIQCSTKPELLYVTYVGYAPKEVPIGAAQLTIPIVIELQKKNVTLKEVTIKAGENPAHRIVYKAIANRKLNDPEQLHSFTYNIYNKLVVTARPDEISDTVSGQRRDSAIKYINKLRHFTDKQHIFLMESVSEHLYLQPTYNKERVLATRTSGFKDTQLSNLATEMQSFSVYSEYFTLLDRRYLNPISKNSPDNYLFVLEDTTYSGKDSVYIISYRPRKGKNFEGMKGFISINTNGYAVQNIIAEPIENKGMFKIKVQQQYEYINNQHWFPTQLNTDLGFANLATKNGKIIGIGHSYLKDIVINPPISKRNFDELALEYATDATNKTDEYWKSYRNDTLTKQDKATYKVIDSLGQASHLDRKAKLFATVLTNKIPFYFVDFDLPQLLRYNEYEGFRLGVGLHTNNKLVKWASIGGYMAYGFRDQAQKYGGDITFNLYKKKELNVNLAYSNDVIEPGGTSYINDQKSILSSEGYRDLYISKMNKIKQYKASINFRALHYMNVQLFVSDRDMEITDGSYLQVGRFPAHKYYFTLPLFGTVGDGSVRNIYSGEIGIAIRYAFREKFTELLGLKIPEGTKYPVVWLQLKNGGVYTTEISKNNVSKVEAKIEYSYFIKQVGKSAIQLNYAYTDFALPADVLYYIKGSFYGDRTFNPSNIYSDNSFQTAGLYEFLANRYVSLHYTHNFGTLLFKGKKFRPEPVLVHNMAIGTLSNPEYQHGLSFKVPDKGLYESGLVINKLLSSGLSAFGIGTFYRYGPYSVSTFGNNLVVKLSLTFSL